MADDKSNFNYPNIIPTDYIDESLSKILGRDNASRISFRMNGSFPAVTTSDIGMSVYRVDLKASFRLVAVDPEVIWVQKTNETGTPITLEMAKLQFQPLNTILTSLSNSLGSKDNFLYFANDKDLQLSPLTIHGRNFMNCNTVAAMRAFLGLGTAATLNTPISGTYIADGTITADKLSTATVNAIGFGTGDVKFTLQTTAPSGWLRMDDGSIGNSLSGASNKQGDVVNGVTLNVQTLYSLLWSLPIFPIQTATGTASSRTDSALIDWNANKRIVLPKVLGRALAVAGQGAGLTLRALGDNFGEEKHQLTVAEMPKHNHGIANALYIAIAWTPGSGGALNPYVFGANGSTGGDVGGDEAHNTMQPTFFMNCFIKL